MCTMKQKITIFLTSSFLLLTFFCYAQTADELVKKVMNEPDALLESIVINICNQILAQFSIVDEVHISIKKLHPPIASFQGSVGVSYTLKRETIQ